MSGIRIFLGNDNLPPALGLPAPAVLRAWLATAHGQRSTLRMRQFDQLIMLLWCGRKDRRCSGSSIPAVSAGACVDQVVGRRVPHHPFFFGRIPLPVADKDGDTAPLCLLPDRSLHRKVSDLAQDSLAVGLPRQDGSRQQSATKSCNRKLAHRKPPESSGIGKPAQQLSRCAAALSRQAAGIRRPCKPGLLARKKAGVRADEAR